MDRPDHPPEVRAAQRLAALLREHRARAGLTQRELAHQVGYSRSSVANAESGDLRGVDFYRRCDEALGSAGVLEAARRTVVPDASAGEPAVAARLDTIPPAELVAHVRRQWHLLLRADDLLGPHAALPAAFDGLATLAALRSSATGPTRTALRRLSARYAATTSWLCQDAGRPGEALTWAGRALEWAHECGDRASVAEALHRHSCLRAAEGDAERALSLARAALRAGTDTGPPQLAALHVQYGRAFALVGDRRRGTAQLLRATVLAAYRNTVSENTTDYGGHCTRSWVLAVRGECALTLGTPTDAVRHLRTALVLMAPEYHRNRGLAAGHLAEALTLVGGPADETRRTAAACRAIGAATGSASVLAQAHRVDGLRTTSAA